MLTIPLFVDYHGPSICQILMLIDLEKTDLAYNSYAQTDDKYKDYDNFDKIKCKGNDLQFFGIEANLGIVMTCLQKAFLYHVLVGEKYVLLALYAIRPSLSSLKIRVTTVKKFPK